MLQDMTTDERLAVCRLVRARFAGRAELERRAARDVYALIALEAKLDLPSPRTAAEELTAACKAAVLAAKAAGTYGTRGTPHERLFAVLLWTVAERVREIRAARLAARPAPAKRPRTVLLTSLHRAIRRAEDAAGIRHAEHAHTRLVAIVAEGAEGATSIAGTMRSCDAGMSAAYCRKAFSVAYSEHTWKLSPGFRPRAEGSAVRISPTVRVRNGRGTSLVVERLTANGRGQLVWRPS